MAKIDTKFLKIILKLGQDKLSFCLAQDGEIYLFIYFLPYWQTCKRLSLSFLYLSFLFAVFNLPCSLIHINFHKTVRHFPATTEMLSSMTYYMNRRGEHL